jgi:cysteine-S-conjugate beta-lyase
MIYDFDTTPQRRQSECIKWNEFEEDVIPMWVADMDFLSPPAVIEALKKRAEHGYFGYPVGVEGDPRQLSELRQTLIDRMDALYGWKIRPEDLLFLPGVATGFNLACHTAAAPHGEILVETPVYPPFLRAPKNAGMERRDVELRLEEDGTYTIDFEMFESAVNSNTKMFLLCNPHNPVGRVFRKEELERMAEICLRNEVLICSDEIHCDLVYPESQHIPIAALGKEIAEQAITLMAPSKTFNIPGLASSFAVIQNSSLRQRFRKAKQGLVGWVNVMGLVATQAAYQEGDEWLAEMLGYLQANRDYLHRFVEEELPGIKMASPEGTYLAWLDCRESGISGSIFDFFLKNARVALMEGSAFGKGGEGFARLNFGCPRSMLEEALIKMKEALLLHFS